MALRNTIVAHLGLKHSGDLSSFDFSKPAQNYKVGDRVGLFTVYDITENEVVMGETDKHLDVRISLLNLITAGEWWFQLLSTSKMG